MSVKEKSVILVADNGFWKQRELVEQEVLNQNFELVFALDMKSVKEVSERVVALVLMDQLCNVDVMDRFPALRVVARTGTGYDNVDVAEAKRRGIVVTRVSKVNAEPASDFALTLLLALSRNLMQLHNKMVIGVWERVPGSVLSEMTIGVVGLGSIGSSLVKKLHALGTKRIVGWNRSRKPEIFGFVNKYGLELLELPELVSESDAVMVAVALAPETAKLLDRKMLSLMKPSAYLVNVSRGAVVDEDALAESVTEGKIAGVGLDVFSVEPPDADPFSQPFMKKLIEASKQGKNVILSPHNAHFTQNSSKNVSLQLALNIKALLASKTEGIEVV